MTPAGSLLSPRDDASSGIVILREDIFLLWPLENNGRLDFLVLTKETSLGETGVRR